MHVLCLLVIMIFGVNCGLYMEDNSQKNTKKNTSMESSLDQPGNDQHYYSDFEQKKSSVNITNNTKPPSLFTDLDTILIKPSTPSSLEEIHYNINQDKFPPLISDCITGQELSIFSFDQLDKYKDLSIEIKNNSLFTDIENISSLQNLYRYIPVNNLLIANHQDHPLHSYKKLSSIFEKNQHPSKTQYFYFSTSNYNSSIRIKKPALSELAIDMLFDHGLDYFHQQCGDFYNSAYSYGFELNTLIKVSKNSSAGEHVSVLELIDKSKFISFFSVNSSLDIDQLDEKWLQFLDIQFYNIEGSNNIKKYSLTQWADFVKQSYLQKQHFNQVILIKRSPISILLSNSQISTSYLKKLQQIRNVRDNTKKISNDLGMIIDTNLSQNALKPLINETKIQLQDIIDVLSSTLEGCTKYRRLEIGLCSVSQIYRELDLLLSKFLIKHKLCSKQPFDENSNQDSEAKRSCYLNSNVLMLS